MHVIFHQRQTQTHRLVILKTFFKKGLQKSAFIALGRKWETIALLFSIAHWVLTTFDSSNALLQHGLTSGKKQSDSVFISTLGIVCITPIVCTIMFKERHTYARIHIRVKTSFLPSFSHLAPCCSEGKTFWNPFKPLEFCSIFPNPACASVYLSR